MAKQLEFEKVKGWGGKRRGAGRPNRTGKVSHGKREPVDFKKPLHITLKVRKGVVNIRHPHLLKEFRRAVRGAKGFGIHIIHFSLQFDHIHIIAEAKSGKCLSAGLKSLNGRLGKAIRKFTGGAGAVFKGRFHMNVLESPTEMKRALEYVLLNTAKHWKFVEHADDFSSGRAFKEWRSLLGKRFRGLIEDQINESRVKFEELSSPQSWLCREGWKRAA